MAERNPGVHTEAPDARSEIPRLRARVDDLEGELTRVTDERDALQDLADVHAAELEDLGRIKEEFIATASHDLKTPLTSILGYAQYVNRLLNGPSPDLEKAVHGMAVIQEQARAMTRLLDDLLDASRIQVGAFGLRPAPCDINTCLTTILVRLTPDECERVDVMLAHAPLSGQWDQKRLEQVLANLVGNALKYSPEDERVSVVVERRPGGIEVAVRDRGMGIPATELRRLFERYYRTPQAHESGLAGSGLGLYVCCSIITAHGGRIWAESSGEGQGATFRFTLPDQPPPGDQALSQQPKGRP